MTARCPVLPSRPSGRIICPNGDVGEVCVNDLVFPDEVVWKTPATKCDEWANDEERLAAYGITYIRHKLRHPGDFGFGGSGVEELAILQSEVEGIDDISGSTSSVGGDERRRSYRG